MISKSSMLWMVVNIMTFCARKTAKELWESLDRKYVRVKKFVVGRFLDYNIVDSKTMVSQL